MRRTLALALTMTSLLAIACGGSAPTSPSRATAAAPSAAIAVAQSTSAALFGASAVDFARCLQTASTSGCFTAHRIAPRDAGGATADAPSALTATANGSTVTLTWRAPTGTQPASAYIIEAGSASGRADLANFPTGNTATTFTASGVPAGTYYVRVRAQFASGPSDASNEAILIVGAAGCTSPPNAPVGLVQAVSGTTVTLTWTAPFGGCAPTSYGLQAGSSSGASDLANSNVGAVTSYVASGVGAGMYYVRVVAVNAYGQSAGSNEVIVTVGGGAPTPAPGGVGGTWVGLTPDGMISDDPQCGHEAFDMQLVFTQTGSNIAGTGTLRVRESAVQGCDTVGKVQTASLTGTVNGNAVAFNIFVAHNTGPVEVLVASATFSATRMTGTIAAEGSAPAATFAVNRQ